MERSATLKVAGPGIYAYRWKLNDGPWSDEVALTNSFFISPTLFADAQPITLNDLEDGDYTAYVVGKNSAGTWQSTNSPTASATWTVSKAGPLDIFGISHDGETFSLQFTAQAGQSYTVQYRESLTSGTWQKLQDVHAAVTAEIVRIPDTPANSGSRFYRIVSPIQP